MSFSLPKAQIIRLKPNSHSSFAVSMPISYGETLLAFSSDYLIFIYNRSDFSESIIETPEPSSTIKLLTFAYNDKRDYFIFCVKDNKKIYQISLKDFSIVKVFEQIGDSIPHSLTSCIGRIFYLSENNLYSLYFLDDNAKIIGENVNYRTVVSSPNGSAIALFTKGEKDIKILYYPFKNDSFIFSFDSPLVDFQWDCSHYLSAVTATEDKTVKIWLQKPNALEMYCIGSFTFSEPITTISFCHNFDDAEFIGKFDNSVGNVAEPSLKRPKGQILVTTADSLALCEESSNFAMTEVMSTRIPFSGHIATICSLFRIYSNGEIEQRFDITFFTENGLFFSQLELASNKYTLLAPFQIKFLERPISKIIPYSDHLMTVSADSSSFYDWFYDKEIDQLNYKVGQFSGKIMSIQNEKIVLVMKSENDQLLTVMANNKNGSFDILKKKRTSFEFQTDDDIVSATIHSENIFAVCTKNEVLCYILENNKCAIFARMKVNKPIARFLPNSYLLIAIASEDSLSFYSVKYNQFTFISKIITVPILDFAYKEDMNAIIVSTENMLFFYDFDIELPEIHKIDDDYVFLTSLTLGMFSVLSKRQKNEIVTINDFITKDDSYILPTSFSPDLPPQFQPFCPLKAPGWEKLGDEGRNFIFSYNFARFNDQALIPFFSIWAFLFRYQHLLIEPLCFQKSREIITSYAPLWVNENSVLFSFVVEIVNKTYPSDEDLDLYLLLCVLVNKFSIASKVALKHGNKKISKYLNSEKDTNLSKVEKSAFEAFKYHRFELASLFFIIMKKNDQALHVIESEPLLQLLVARLLNETERTQKILHENEFFNSSLNRFFTAYTENKEEAVKILINYELPKCDLISLDAHRCEMLKCMTKDIPKSMLLNLQFIPYFIKKFYIKPIIKSSNKKQQQKPSSYQEFDFGGIEQIDMIDGVEEEEEEEETKENEILIDDSNFAYCFDKPLFKTNANVIFTINESFIIEQINKLFNVQFDERTVKSLTSITKLISDRATIAAILFSMSFALSKTTMIIPLLESFEFNLENYFDEFEHCKVEIKPPDLLSRFANDSSELNENDINIVNCLTFNKMAKNLSTSNNFNNIKILAFYFHHRHRILFKKIKSFFFSNEGIIDDIDPLQLNPILNLEKMEKVSLHEKWLIAFNGTFSTPFYMDNQFNFTRSFIVKTGLEPPIKGITIDQQNNQNVAIVSESLNTIKVSQDELNGKYQGASEEDKYLYFDSPFSPLLEENEIAENATNEDFNFECVWHKVKVLKTFLKTTACDSHPINEIFVTGEMNGNLRFWNFKKGILRSIYSASFIESSIKSVKFNDTGDKLLVVNKEGQIYMNDFSHKNDEIISIVCSREKSTATWFNNSNQIAVVHPKDSLFCLYDIRVPPSTLTEENPSKSVSIPSIDDTEKSKLKFKSKSSTALKKLNDVGNLNLLKPVISYNLLNTYDKRCPIDVWEHRVAIGNPDGRILIYDIRNMNPSRKCAHQGNVKAVKFHPTGKFMISGGLDNNICINDPNDFYRRSEVIKNVLPISHSSYDRKSGITDVAVSKQCIVVGGYSKVVQVWTVENEKSRAIKKSASLAIDLRNITYLNDEVASDS